MKLDEGHVASIGAEDLNLREKCMKLSTCISNLPFLLSLLISLDSSCDESKGSSSDNACGHIIKEEVATCTASVKPGSKLCDLYYGYKSLVNLGNIG